MKKILATLSILMVFTQCSENEPEIVVLPKLISLSAAMISQTGPYHYRIEFKGQFSDGEDPVNAIKLARGVNNTPGINPKSLYIDNSVNVVRGDSNTFTAQIEIDSDYWTMVSFYFISENTPTYSETYSYNYFDGKSHLSQIYPNKR